MIMLANLIVKATIPKMKIFSDLRDLIRMERRYLPFIGTLEDREIAAQIGYHDVFCEKPLTMKHLYLLDIGSIATVQRRLARLVAKGVIVKRRLDEDHRAFALHLSASAKREFRRFGSALAYKATATVESSEQGTSAESKLRNRRGVRDELSSKG